MVKKLRLENYHSKCFCGGGILFMLICRNDKKCVPNILRKYVVNWYHIYLLHLGTECTEVIIGQHY